MQQLIASIFTFTAGCISMLFGLVYLFRSSFLNYHKEAIQKDWVEITPAFQILILALMRAVSGGAIAAGFSIIVLQYYFIKTNLAWIPLLILSNGVIISLCSLYAMLLVRRKTPGKPPLVIIFISLLLLIAGYYLIR
ncbi:MAG: hypothetical protein WDO16_24350 [Bacteroidota bacterium]